ncbi:RloB family protein [Clostridium ganghwense]|uniref:RloB family protein n=1 Tax=Clostridium ganghwense TaxID=312089 RepID=A0ABT4CQ92_9CLOT|nr:RloB family protein [Clostridium ganghwense]MCY6371227.1 RloB family protein [Clostridium ganghwense]
MRVPKQYGKRTLYFDKVQEARAKYIFVYEGQETEVQYFQGVIDRREDLNINPLIDLLPILRGTLQLSHSHPLQILKYIDEHIDHYHTVDIIVNKIVDYCFENLGIKENNIYNVKTLYDDIFTYLCNKYNLEKNSEFVLTNDILEDLSNYLKDKINILEQIENIQKYIDEQEIIYNKDIDKLCLVIDRDKGNVKSSQYDEIIQKCNDKGIKLYVSNPTFEFWLLLHSSELPELDKCKLLKNNKSGKKRYLEKELTNKFNGYKKHNIKFERFFPYITLAIQQEKSFCEDIHYLKDKLGTNVGLLLSELIDNS